MAFQDTLTPSQFTGGTPVKNVPDEFFESPLKSGSKSGIYTELELGRLSDLPSIEDMIDSPPFEFK